MMHKYIVMIHYQDYRNPGLAIVWAKSEKEAESNLKEIRAINSYFDPSEKYSVWGLVNNIPIYGHK